MKIIVLEGGTNTGKTTTMGVVFVALHMNGGKVNTFTPLNTPSGMDFEAVLDYPDPTDEKKTLKVAMYSKGDNIYDCNAAIKKYLQHSPPIDVLIIAFSKKVRPLHFPPNNQPIKVQKTVASPTISEVQANANDGYQIICHI
jgi:hypothetical protein